MAKMFYTLDEVCQKLGKSEDEVKEMARSGQIQEFRDREKLMFKVDQIDLLAGGDEDSAEVHLDLEDTSGGSGLELSTSGSGLELQDTGLGLEESRLGLEESRLGLEESREATGISVFDTDHGGSDETGDKTRSEESGIEEDDLSLESVGSGSGLLDLTRESDDTSLGAELLEEVYSGDENIEIPASASGLFEAAGSDAVADVAVSGGSEMGAVPMVMETYDGGGSGLGAGLMVGALLALVCVAIIVVVGIFGTTPDLAMKMASSSNTLMIWGGGLLGGTLLLGAIGFFIGKATE